MKITKRYLFYVLAFTSSIIAAIMSGFDAVVKVFIEDPWVLGLSVFLLGVLVSFLFTLFFSIKIGEKSLGSKIIDPSFKKIRLIKKQELKYHLIAGLGNAIMTLGYFELLSMLGDPSVVLPFSQVVILYLVIFESITEKNVPTLVEIQSSAIVTFGAILGSISLSGSLSLQSLAVVFLVINPGWVLFSLGQRKLKMMKIKNSPNDSINIRLWNVTFACIFTIIFVMIFDFVNNTNRVAQSISASIENFGWIALIAIGTFFSFTLYIRSLGIGKASVVQAVRSSIIIFTLPVSIVLAYLGIIEPFSTDPVLLLIKTMGISLMVLGILSFALTLTKAYIFIKMKTGYPIDETMKKIWNVRGVTRVTATAGPYDYIVKIRTRTLVKGYENILRKIAEIDGIDSYKWESVLREWENI